MLSFYHRIRLRQKCKVVRKGTFVIKLEVLFLNNGIFCEGNFYLMGQNLSLLDEKTLT